MSNPNTRSRALNTPRRAFSSDHAVHLQAAQVVSPLRRLADTATVISFLFGIAVTAQALALPQHFV